MLGSRASLRLAHRLNGERVFQLVAGVVRGSKVNWLLQELQNRIEVGAPAVLDCRSTLHVPWAKS